MQEAPIGHGEDCLTDDASARVVPGDLPIVPAPLTTPLAGQVAFASPEAQVQRRSELLGDGALVVSVPAPPATERGHLGEFIDERIERELAARGAPSPYLASWSSMPDDIDARLADQLFRARSVGGSGIAVLLGSLARVATPALCPEDSLTLRRLAQAAADRPVVLLVDDADRALAGYAAPVRIASWIEAPSAPPARSDALTSALALVPAPDLDPAPAATPAPAQDADAWAEARVFEGSEDALPEGFDDGDGPLDPEALAEIVPPVVLETAFHDAAARTRRETAGVPAVGPRDTWRPWALALSAAKGPQALGALEKLFCESYVPLASAVAAGLDDPRALRAHDDFRRGFERACTDAQLTFGVTTRRPRMVMDAFDIASKLARVHGARTAHVLLVDSLRFDLGNLVRDAVSARCDNRASLTTEALLWSALPTTTLRQLETLARGVEALRAPEALDPAQESLRGRSAEHVRKMRVGSRELGKLDLVPALLTTKLERLGTRATSEDLVGYLPELADAVADVVARHLLSLPPRALLLVVGDHGFTFDKRGRIAHGGASPEEVLVPAYAYLAGDLH